jgi:hypothetical protein
MTENADTSTHDASNLASFGDFTFDPDARTLRGLLIPFGEKSRTASTGQSEVEFSADTIDLPRDPSVVTLNREHNRHDPVGRAVELTKSARGVEATFQLADTDEADDWLSRQKSTLRKLSAEVIFAADKVRAKLTGSALVTEGAFASAGLFALAEDAEPETPDEDTPSEEPEAAEAVESEDAVTDIATLPEGVQPAGDPKTVDTSASALFSAIAKHGENGDASALFAISNVQASGPSGAAIAADTQNPEYLGEIWAKNPYSRKFLPLFEQRSLTSFKVDGWRWVTTPTVAAYSGNVSDVPSNTVDTEPVTATARRIAGGHKIDRRFADFGDQGVIESYMQKMTESYARVSDADILGQAVTASTAVSLGSASGGPVALDAIVDGALGVIASENTPNFAVVSPELWRDIVLTGKNDTLGYLQAGFGLEEGSVEGFRIIPGAVGTGNVLVGSKNALTVFELPGAPIRVEGISPHQGSIDPALYGYLAHLVNNSAALSLVDTAPAGE